MIQLQLTRGVGLVVQLVGPTDRIVAGDQELVRAAKDLLHRLDTLARQAPAEET